AAQASLAAAEQEKIASAEAIKAAKMAKKITTDAKAELVVEQKALMAETERLQQLKEATQEQIAVANNIQRNAKKAEDEAARYQISLANQIASLEATRKAIELNRIALDASKNDIEMEKATVLAIQISAQQTEQAAAEGWSCVLKAVRQLNEARSQAEVAKSEAIEATRQLTIERGGITPHHRQTVSPVKAKGPGTTANARNKTEVTVEVATRKR
ncbi:hypothetical protein OAF37_02480, partial [Rubripirellula sp.]